MMGADVIVCYARCWGCMFGEHFAPPEWHTWAGFEDIEHDPTVAKQRCACECASARALAAAEGEE